MTEFEKWLYTWKSQDVSRYTFPDGITVEFSDEKLLKKYYKKYQSKVMMP